MTLLTINYNTIILAFYNLAVIDSSSVLSMYLTSNNTKIINLHFTI